MAENSEHEFWYNFVTGEVEEGRLSPAVDRAGPYPTRAQAEHALQQLRHNSEKWAEEEEEDY